jgi:hypothetical protein
MEHHADRTHANDVALRVAVSVSLTARAWRTWAACAASLGAAKRRVERCIHRMGLVGSTRRVADALSTWAAVCAPLAQQRRALGVAARALLLSLTSSGLRKGFLTWAEGTLQRAAAIRTLRNVLGRLQSHALRRATATWVAATEARTRQRQRLSAALAAWGGAGPLRAWNIWAAVALPAAARARQQERVLRLLSHAAVSRALRGWVAAVLPAMHQQRRLTRTLHALGLAGGTGRLRFVAMRTWAEHVRQCAHLRVAAAALVAAISSGGMRRGFNTWHEHACTRRVALVSLARAVGSLRGQLRGFSPCTYSPRHPCRLSHRARTLHAIRAHFSPWRTCALCVVQVSCCVAGSTRGRQARLTSPTPPACSVVVSTCGADRACAVRGHRGQHVQKHVAVCVAACCVSSTRRSLVRSRAGVARHARASRRTTCADASSVYCAR